VPLTTILPTITAHPYSLVERETGPSGDQVWWRLRVTQQLREVWQMLGVTNADLARVVAHGVASNDWYWSLRSGLLVVFRHETDALKAAERFYGTN
jgi:hypothetical protein